MSRGEVVRSVDYNVTSCKSVESVMPSLTISLLKSFFHLQKYALLPAILMTLSWTSPAELNALHYDH